MSIFIGIGGCGCNIVSILAKNHAPLQTIAINQDEESLNKLDHVKHKLLLDEDIFHAKSASKQLGKHLDKLRFVHHQDDEIVLFTGLGGRCGSFVTVALLETLKLMGKTVTVFAITPLNFEGAARGKLASESLHSLRQHADVLLVYSNQMYLAGTSVTATMQDTLDAMNGEVVQAALEEKIASPHLASAFISVYVKHQEVT